ncbi:MAG: lactate 2-monooxygenase [Calditrichota bacterium]
MSDKKPSPQVGGNDRQRDIYIAGARAKKPLVPIDFSEMEKAAAKKISLRANAYIAGGAGNEESVLSNRSDFSRWRIIPRMLRNVSERDTSVELFGKKLDHPFLLSPIGVLELAHQQADLAVAKAAAANNIPMIFSNQASRSMEECAGAMGEADRWFQLYWSKSDELVASLVKRAENCGCKAIVVTLDTTMLGWRTRDLDLAYLPFMEGKGIAQYTSDPVFLKMLDEPMEQTASGPINIAAIKTLIKMTKAFPGSFMQNLRSGLPRKAVQKFIQIYSRPSLTWENLEFLRGITGLPILLKGILHRDDARKALDYGLDGIIVSNHGGRQVDGSISSIAALPDVVEIIDNKIPVLLDSGIRGGADVFKALALGATAVCIGRPYVYGLALAGEVGVDEVLKNFQADFELTMGLSGCKGVAEISRDCLVRA